MKSWIKNYVGLPYENKGRGENGYDCWGLVRLIYKEIFLIDMPSYIDSYKNTDDSTSIGPLVTEKRDSWNVISFGLEKIGDIIIIRMMGQPMHMGLVLEENLFLHIEKGINSVVENYKTPKWSKRVIGFYRHRSVETL